MKMKTFTIRFHGERALFRNFRIPGSDVADESVDERTRAIKGLIGNMLGLWRDFDDATNLGLAATLEEWCTRHSLSVNQIQYKAGESRLVGQHRFKSPGKYTTAGESGPKTLTYHWNVCMDVVLTLDESGARELANAVKQPTGTPYLGQSNCLAQVHLFDAGGIQV